MVGEGKELVDRLGSGVAPAVDRGGAIDAPLIFVERTGAAVIPVHLRGGRHERALSEAAAHIKHHLGAPQVRHKRMDRSIHHQAHTDGGGKVPDPIAAMDEAVHHRLLEHRVDDEMESRPVKQMGDVGSASGRQVVERKDLVSTIEKGFAQMRADKAGAAGHQVPNRGRGLTVTSHSRRLYIRGPTLLYLSSGLHGALHQPVEMAGEVALETADGSREPRLMLTREEDMEAHHLKSRRRSISAIARRLRRDRKTIRA